MSVNAVRQASHKRRHIIHKHKLHSSRSLPSFHLARTSFCLCQSLMLTARPARTLGRPLTTKSIFSSPSRACPTRALRRKRTRFSPSAISKTTRPKKTKNRHQTSRTTPDNRNRASCPDYGRRRLASFRTRTTSNYS